MAWKPPVQRRRNRSLLNDKRFFQLLTHDCASFAGPETVRMVYYMMIGLIGRELRLHKVCRLPHLCDIGWLEQKPRPSVAGSGRIWMGPRRVLRLYPAYRFRRYFNMRAIEQTK